MYLSLRVSLACLAGFIGLVAVASAPSDWLGTVGVDSESHLALPSEMPLLLESPHEFWVVESRIRAKSRVAALLVAGELDLFAAAAWFRELNHEPPDRPQLAYHRLPGATDEEKLCREVIDWMRELGAGQARPLADELEVALAYRLGMAGRIELRRPG